MSHSFININQHPDTETATVFLPGWGFDGNILRLLKPSPSWIYPETFLDPDSAEQDILHLITECNMRKIRIIGWSMGAILGLNFAAKHPEMVESLILVSLRALWPAHEIKQLQVELAGNQQAFLNNFYRKCFLGNKTAYKDFCKFLEPSYLNAAEENIEILNRGLEYLAKYKITDRVPGIPIRLIHGKQDIIAPVAEMATLEEANVEIIENEGHAVFLAENCSLQNELRKLTIRNKFSRAADSYDHYAKVQTEVARKLAAKLPPLQDTAGKNKILELGCGTGNFTSLLTEKFPAAKITALDFSQEMIVKANSKLNKEAIDFVCADGEDFLEAAQDRSFDQIVSNGSMQWFTDHDRAFKNIARTLLPGGTFSCSIFGPDSLKKLGQGLKVLLDFQGNVAADAFPDVNTLQNILNKHFTHGAAHQELIEKHYNSVFDLLMHIKKTGTGGWHQHGLPALTPARLKQLNNWFIENHGSCRVTYQVHFLLATK